VTQQVAKSPIELRLREVAQLFNTLDPFPFRERDLAPEAEDYIVDWAEELPAAEPIKVVVHLESAGDPNAATDVAAAITAWFAEREAAETKALRSLFRDGRRAFLIGIAILALCLFLAWQLSVSFEGPLARILQESLIIIGWVVIWRPAEMFLYDWLPMVRQRKLFRRLANATVTVSPSKP